jgi:hypothetical protein
MTGLEICWPGFLVSGPTPFVTVSRGLGCRLRNVSAAGISQHSQARLSSDIRVIISACRAKKISDDHPYIWRYTARRALVIFDHPYNADYLHLLGWVGTR